MNDTAVNDLLNRVESGETTVADAESLRHLIEARQTPEGTLDPSDLDAIDDLLDAIEAGTLTAADKEAIRTLMGTRHFLPKRAHAELRRMREMQGRNVSESPRVGSAVTILITYTCDRYPRGELVIQNHYRLDDGITEHDRSRRVYLREQTRYLLQELWELLFEHAAIASQYHPTSTIIRLELPQGLGATHTHVRAVAEAVAFECRAMVAGTAPNPAD